MRAALAAAFLLSLTLFAAQGPPSDLVPLQIIVAPSAAEAQAIRDQISRGGSFSELAIEKSIDPTAPDGGNLGRMSIA